jgi:hypothetical protein
MKELTIGQKKLLESDKEKEIDFTIVLHGRGRTVEEAWDEAVESFTMDPGAGFYEDITEVEEVEED